MTRIHLTIDRVVLSGLPAGQDKELIASLRAQINEMLANRDTRADWARSHRTPVMKLGRIPLQSGPTGARQLGRKIGQGIGRGLKP
ncbi:hypothetical protein Acid345_0858 [Candidatus Koribacter versatilis Ellin345]|uniref:Uncharacterized protein n=1 Tax=Koribacter versatilis (strain Ellin345) TaxID=204669 RepID=Q1ITD7_KORVE|nr:hypothetical protein [Candidatus Koribacter versatilis]ABF39863.1 hypothetical protein Acid345_0858 [Candidatus Koribacter versatilis Ellin345]